jgi:hypothetical protein
MPDQTDNDEEKTTVVSDPEEPAEGRIKKPRRARTSDRATRAAAADDPAEDGVRRVEVVEIATAAPGDVEGEVVVVRQGGVNIADARQIDLRQGGIGRAHADDIAVTQGGIGIARGERISVELGGLGLAVANEVHVTQGMASTVLARDVHIEQAGARTIIASHATLGRNVGVFMLIAGRVEGNVRTLLDWRGAIAFGAAFGLVAGLVRRRRS